MSIPDPAAFIRDHTRLMAVPHAPEIALHLADEATELWRKTQEELGDLGLPAPFWAFAWAGGQALARCVLDHPAIVRGRRVLDFAAGSGLVGIAAAKAGAASVAASEIDAFAGVAIGLNARANAVTIDVEMADLVGVDRGWQTVLAGDICYEKPMADRVIDWLRHLHARGAEVLIGDPGRAYLPRDLLAQVAEYRVPVTRALEDSEVKRTAVWRFRSDAEMG